MIGGELLGYLEVARVGDLEFALAVEGVHDGVGGDEDCEAVGGVGFFEDGVNVGYFGEEAFIWWYE